MFCRESAARDWIQFELETQWIMEEDLVKPASKREATKAACGADMVVFALSDRPMPERIYAWAEAALSKRCEKEGRLALVGDARSSRNELALRNLAHRAGLDFITSVPPSLGSCLPESPEPYTNQAHEVSDLLVEILSQPQPTVQRLPVR
jgi:hypothetical protein